jgi:predicted nucleotidyltransferase
MEAGQDGVEWDSTIYEIRKMINLLLKCNPNVLSLLWLPEELWVIRTPLGQKLLDNRGLFVSKAAYHSFVGYSNGQLKRMTGISTGLLGRKRKELVEAFGYDTKNASHLIRLLRLGIEFLTEGSVKVVRSDAVELLEIKQGKWSLEKVQRESEDLFRLAREAYVRSPLPPEPDHFNAEKLLIEIIESHFNK